MRPGTPHAAYKCPKNHYCSSAATESRTPAGAVSKRMVRCPHSECRTPAGRGSPYTLSRSGGSAVSGGFAKGRGGWWQLFEGEGAEQAASAAASAPGATAVTAAAVAAAHAEAQGGEGGGGKGGRPLVVGGWAGGGRRGRGWSLVRRAGLPVGAQRARARVKNRRPARPPTSRCTAPPHTTTNRQLIHNAVLPLTKVANAHRETERRAPPRKGVEPVVVCVRMQRQHLPVRLVQQRCCGVSNCTVVGAVLRLGRKEGRVF